jgi:hypothetical protein
MQTSELLKRIDFVILKGTSTLGQKQNALYGPDFVPQGLFAGFRSQGLSLISEIFGEKHTYYKEFMSLLKDSSVDDIEAGIHILQSLRYEVEQGWLTTLRRLVSAEIFSDFLEMSKYLLQEKYKDPAAVMIGSVLEEHLRLLCTIHSIDTFVIKNADHIPKKADLINADLAKAGVYGVLEQKNVTAWLDLRNRAAHGKYVEYTIEQVHLMYQGVLDFLTRVK